MRRTDRLFELIQILRDGRLHRARDLAELVEVSVRTIWRDMASLAASGLPVEGERGVGYMLREPIALPPLTLTAAELEALELGTRLVAEGADPSLAPAARSLHAKLVAAIPASRPRAAEAPWLFVFGGPEAQAAAPHLPAIRRAIRRRERLRIAYAPPDAAPSERTLRPLQLEFWGRVWTLTAWCEARDAFRTFRVDRIAALAPDGTQFPVEPGRELDDIDHDGTAGPA
jgi:predicted DNA-binding transcriptional regulator YafY